MHTNRLYRAAALSFTIANAAQPQSRTNLVHQFSPPYWVENLAVRPNGNIIPIATLGTSAILQQLNSATGSLEEIYDFEKVGNSIQGITSIMPDVFVVNVLTCNTTALDCTPGSASSWLIEFQKDQHSPKEPVVTELTTWPNEGLLNGMAALDNQTVLIADSFLGGIWSLDIRSRVGKLLFTDPSMMPTTEIATGINGIRIRPGKLYFTNSATATFNSINIDSTGVKVGQASVIARNLTGPDDFEIDKARGLAYLANGAANQIVSIDLLDGAVNQIASVPGPTSLRWSHGEETQLYVSTNGGLLQYATHNITVGGAIYSLVL